MTVRKGIPRLGKHRKEPDFGTKCPEVAGSVPTPEHAAIVGAPAKPHGFVGRGGKDITLLGQNVDSYGRDLDEEVGLLALGFVGAELEHQQGERQDADDEDQCG